MSSLKYGLNIKGKPKQSIAKGINLSKNRKQNPLQDDSEEDSNERLGLEVSHQAVINRELNLSHEKTSIKEKEMQNKALEANPNMYEYDELYDDLKRQEVYIKNIKDGVTADGTKKAKYMENLINNSNKRKSYLEQAKQRKMLKEREDEKELFGDKEEFVTESYRLKQVEIKRLEDEEKRKEELEIDPNRERDVAGFYRTLMDSRIASVIRLSEEDIKAIELQKSSIEKNELSKKNIIEKSSARINESGEILDKRDLLSGGLNLTYKSIEKKHSEIQAAIIREEKSKKEVVLKQIEQKERQRKYIEQQEKLMNARLASEKIVQEKELAEKIASKITNSSVLSAKERFLQRKKQQDKSANEEP